MGLAGAIAGALLPKYPIAGIPSGVLAGVGALGALALVLEKVAVINNVILCLIAALGALPGIGLYFALRWLLLPPSTRKKTREVPQRRRPLSYLISSKRASTLLPVRSVEATSSGKKKTDNFLAIQPDRVCLQCGTRYAPPTPRWGGFVYLFAALVGFVGAAGCLSWNHIEAGQGPFRLGREFLLALLMAGLGAACLVLGCRCFFGKKQRSKVVEAHHGDQTN